MEELGLVQLGVKVDLATLKSQLDEARGIVAGIGETAITPRLDLKAIQQQLKTLRINVNDSQVQAANTRLQTLTKRLDALRSAAPVKLQVQFDGDTQELKDIGGGIRQVANAYKELQQVTQGFNSKNLPEVGVRLRGTQDTAKLEAWASAVGKVKRAAKDLPSVSAEVGISATGATKAREEVEAVLAAAQKLQADSPFTVRVDVVGDAIADIGRVEQRLAGIQPPPAIQLESNADAIVAALGKVETTAGRLKENALLPLNLELRTTSAADELATFRKQAATAVELPLTLDTKLALEAFGSFAANLPERLPDVLLDANTKEATAKVQGLADQLANLTSKPYVVNVEVKQDGTVASENTQVSSAQRTVRQAAQRTVQQAPVRDERTAAPTPPVKVTVDTDEALGKIAALQEQLNQLTSKPYVVNIQAAGADLEFLKSGKMAEATRGSALIPDLAGQTASAVQASVLRDELFQRINAERRTGQPGDTAFGRKGFVEFLERTGGLPEGVTPRSTRAELQSASRSRLQQLPDAQLLELIETLRSISNRMGAGGAAGGPAGGGQQPQRSWLDQIARMAFFMAGLDDTAIRRQIQERRQPARSQFPELWNRITGPGRFEPAQRPPGTPLLGGVPPINRSLLSDPVLRDPRRLLAPDGGLDQPRRFAERLNANQQRNAAQFQEQRLASDLANNAARSRRLLPSGLDKDLQEILRNAANAFVDQLRRQLNAAVRQVQVRDLGPSASLDLPAGADPIGFLPTSTAAGRAEARSRAERTQAAFGRSAAREQAVRAQLLLPPAIGNFDTRRREDAVRRAQEQLDAGQLRRRPGETPVRALQRAETTRNAAEFRLAQRRFEREQQESQRLAQEREREQARLERERLAQERQVTARRDRRVRTRNDVISNALIGGAFPALFGQGFGASVGGAVGGGAGALLGPGFGFGGSLLGTALGASFDSSINSLQTLASGFDDPIKSFQALQEAALLSSRAVEKNAQALIEAGRAEEAAARVRLDLLQEYGTIAPLGDEADTLRRSFAELGVTMAQLATGPLGQLAGVVDSFLRFISTIPRAAIERLTGVQLLPDNKATPEQLAQQEQAVRDARFRSKQLFAGSKELAALGGRPDTIANQERAFELQLEQSQLRQEAELNAADPENGVLRRSIRQRGKLERLDLKASREQFRRQNRLELEQATRQADRQVGEGRTELDLARRTSNLFRPGQAGSRQAIEELATTDKARQNRDNALADLAAARDRQADPSEIATLTGAFDRAVLDYESALTRSVDALRAANRNITEEARNLTRQLEDARTGQAVREGTDAGINQFLTNPRAVAERENESRQQLLRESQQVLDQLGQKEGRPLSVSFTGSTAEQNAQIAEFISKGRDELRGGEDIGRMQEQLNDTMASLVRINEALVTQTETLAGATTSLAGATESLAQKNWNVYVNVNSGSVGGDGRVAQVVQ